MAKAPRKSFRQRLLKGQGGNVVVYLVGGMILWLVFFTVTDWIRDTKNSRNERDKKVAQQETRYFHGDIYHNPYQQPSK